MKPFSTAVFHSPRRLSLAALGLSLVSAAAAVPVLLPLAQAQPAGPQTLTIVSYAVTKTAYDEITKRFAAEWKAKTGQTVTFRGSYGGSGSQTRAVIDGLEADVVNLAMAADVSKIEKAGLIKSRLAERAA